MLPFPCQRVGESVPFLFPWDSPVTQRVGRLWVGRWLSQSGGVLDKPLLYTGRLGTQQPLSQHLLLHMCTPLYPDQNVVF